MTTNDTGAPEAGVRDSEEKGTAMDTIVPRCEWRTFGTDFGAAEATFAALEPELTQESDEVYLLSRGADAAVKIRAGLMGIKELREVNAAGLQQ